MIEASGGVNSMNGAERFMKVAQIIKETRDDKA
jgi:hypothetical protein